MSEDKLTQYITAWGSEWWVEKLISTHLKQKELLPKFLSIQKKKKEFAEKVANSDLHPEEKQDAFKALLKLFLTIKSEDIWWIWDISIPQKSATLNFYEIALLWRVWISIWSWKNWNNWWSFQKRLLNESAETTVAMYDIYKIRKDQDWKITERIKTDKTKWKKEWMKVRLWNHDIDEEFDVLKKAWQDLYTSISSWEYKQKTTEIATELANTIAWLNRTTKFWHFTEDMLWNWDTLPLSEWSITETLKWKWTLSMAEWMEALVQAQQKWDVPSIFNPESLDKIKPGQTIFLLVDKSSSTSEDWVFKLIDIATSQTKKLIEDKLWNKVEVYVITYSDFIDKILQDIPWFMYPLDWTNTELGMEYILRFMIAHKAWQLSPSKLEKFAWNFDTIFHNRPGIERLDQILVDLLTYDKRKYESSYDRKIEWFFEEERNKWNNIDISKLRSSWSTHIDKFVNFTRKRLWKQWLANYHIINIWDWLPNDIIRTLYLANCIKRLRIWFSQITIWHTFRSVNNIIKQELIRELTWMENFTKDFYKRQIDAVANTAWWSSSILWADEHLVTAILWQLDLSIGLAHANDDLLELLWYMLEE